MTDVGETMRVFLRGINTLSPTTKDTTDNLLRFKALTDLAEASLKLAANFKGEQDVETFQTLLRVGRQAEQLWPMYAHAADEMGD